MPRSRPAKVRDRGLLSEAPRMKARVRDRFVNPKSSIVTGLLLLLAAVSPLAAQTSMKSRRDFLVGDHPVGLVATDYDADTYLDLITVNQQTAGIGDVALVKGFGDGTFRKV